ncbi:MAG: hypothetical protein V4510_10600 [bacterium]
MLRELAFWRQNLPERRRQAWKILNDRGHQLGRLPIANPADELLDLLQDPAAQERVRQATQVRRTGTAVPPGPARPPSTSELARIAAARRDMRADLLGRMEFVAGRRTSLPRPVGNQRHHRTHDGHGPRRDAPGAGWTTPWVDLPLPSTEAQGARDRAWRALERTAAENIRTDVNVSILEADTEVRRVMEDLHWDSSDWRYRLIVQYSGVRYQSAHGSYLSPSHLLDVLQHTEAGTLTERPAPRQPLEEVALVNPSRDEAVAELRRLRARGAFSDAAWRDILLRGHLVPRPEDRPAIQLAAPVEPAWSAVFMRWAQGQTTQWLAAVQASGPGTIVLPTVVCNQLAEIAQSFRGNQLSGGITGDARDYAGRGLLMPGRMARLEPRTSGHGVFFVHPEWLVDRPPSYSVVLLPPSISFANLREPNGAGEPAVQKPGWTIVRDDGPVRRTRLGPSGLETEWAAWAHEATVLEVMPTGVLLMETTDRAPLPGQPTPSAGVTMRSQATLAEFNSYIGFADPAVIRRARRRRRSPGGAHRRSQ